MNQSNRRLFASIMGVLLVALGAGASYGDSSSDASNCTTSNCSASVSTRPESAQDLYGPSTADMFHQDLGASRIHLALDAQGGYESNPYLLPVGDRANTTGEIVLSLMPSGYFDVEGESFSLATGFNARGALYLGLEDDVRPLLTQGQLYVRGAYNPQGQVSLHAGGAVDESRKVKNVTVASLTRITHSFNLGTTVRPCLGDLTIDIDGDVVGNTFLDVGQPAGGKVTNESLLDDNGYFISGKVNWNFMPDYYAFVSGKYGIWDERRSADTISARPTWLEVGAGGKLMSDLTGHASAGFAKTWVFNKDTQVDLGGLDLVFVADAGMDWRINDNTDLSVDLYRVMNNPVAYFYENYKTGIDANFRMRFMDNLAVMLNPTFSWYQYGGVVAAGTRPNVDRRSDLSLDTTEELRYNVNSWFDVSVSHEGYWRWTNAASYRIDQTGGQSSNSTKSFTDEVISNQSVFLTASLYY